jgi:IclR family pca regulon transcriptional regulator
LARQVIPLLVQTAERISADLGHRAGTTRRSVVLEGRDGFF